MNKILIIRNDKLGDFMLSYPSFALARQNLPGTEIHALVPGYTKAMAEVCPWIDKVIIDPGKDAGLTDNLALVKQIRREKYDAVVTLFSTTRIAVISFLAGIPLRIAPATKLAQLFYNHRVRQKRSRSEKPEFVYNMDLVNYLLEYLGHADIQEPDTPYLVFPGDEVRALREQFIKQHNIPASHKLIFIHPGSGGSASNLSPREFAELGKYLQSGSGHTIVITAGPGELDAAQQTASKLGNVPHVIFESKSGLVDFSKHIQFADLFISGSTGPLHIAGALDTSTAGFYPRRRSATPLRWQTLNWPQNRLAFCPEENAEQEDMSSIDLKQAAQEISQKFLGLEKPVAG